MLISDINGIKMDPRRVPESPVLGRTMFGIEIEVENVGAFDPRSVYWTVTRDPSLRNEGAELVLISPLGGLDLENALEELAGMYNNNPQWQVNDRCSVHCHLDFRGGTVQDVISFYVTWLLFEAGMYTVSGKDRYSNIYCMGSNSCKVVLEAANELYTADRAERAAHSIGRWSKYTGVNLAALNRFGSVEVRTHRGTCDADDVRNWCALLDRMKQWSSDRTPEEVVQQAGSRGYTALANEIFGDMARLVLCDNLDQYYELNYMNACDVVHFHKLVPAVPEDSSDIEAMVRAVFAEIGV